MSIDANFVREALRNSLMHDLDIYERRPGNYQLIIPILHEDGDMVDVYIQESPLGDEYVRICDYGLTLMRLSYSFNVSTPTRQQILDSILINNSVENDSGNLYIEAPIHLLYESILQFAGCVQKVCNMRYWSREIVRSTFYDDLRTYVTTELWRFSPVADQSPLTDYPVISVDWTLTFDHQPLYIYGVRGNDKAKSVAISLLEFKKRSLSFISLIVHENWEDLGRRESIYLTNNADHQYTNIDEFRDNSVQDIERFVGAHS